MRKYKNPAFLIGNGCRGITEEIRKCKYPMLVTWRAMDIIPNDHPQFAGRPGSIAFKDANVTLQMCDLLVVVGARLDPASVGYSYDNLAPNARKIVCDIDQAELDKLPDSWGKICVDVKDLIKELYDKPL